MPEEEISDTHVAEEAVAEMTTEASAPDSELQAHQRNLTEKMLRESAMALSNMTIGAWPRDEDGRPMAIAMGMASDLQKTGDFQNAQLGPCGIMRPVKNHENLDDLAREVRAVQLIANYVIGTERRALMKAKDPSIRIDNPSDAFQEMDGPTFETWVANKIGIRLRSDSDLAEALRRHLAEIEAEEATKS